MENKMQDLVLFIARRSNCDGTAEETKEGLRQSLSHTRRKYVGQYGLLNPNDNIKPLVFIQSSNKAFPRDGDTVRQIKAVLNNGRATNRPVVLAVNGWDGLSTNSVALVNLFRPYINEVQITMVIWLQELQVFRKVSVKHAILMLSGEYEGEVDDFELPWATKEYIGKIQVIAAWKNNISVDTLALREETMNRNRVPSVEGNSWFCEFPDCDKVCRTSERLVDHMHKHHGPKVSCRYCGREFTRTDHRDRHEKEVCLENPTVRAAKEAEPPKKRAKRGSKSKTLQREQGVVASDDGVPPYQLIQQNTWNFPRVDKDAPFSERVVYKMEVFCRFPGCCWKTRFSEPTNLRDHYRLKHEGWTYPAQAPGMLDPIDSKFHDEGLEYLARCAHWGWQHPNAGSPPTMSSRRNSGGAPEQPSAEVSRPAPAVQPSPAPVVKPTNFMEGWLARRV